MYDTWYFVYSSIRYLIHVLRRNKTRHDHERQVHKNDTTETSHGHSCETLASDFFGHDSQTLTARRNKRPISTSLPQFQVPRSDTTTVGTAVVYGLYEWARQQRELTVTGASEVSTGTGWVGCCRLFLRTMRLPLGNVVGPGASRATATWAVNIRWRRARCGWAKLVSCKFCPQ